MINFSDFVGKQVKIILENKQHGIFFAVVFSLLPFASWISVTLVSLITLRKGARAGYDVLVPALVIHSVPLMLLMPIENALIHSLVSYIPCYIAALTLRRTISWQSVCGILLLQAFLGAFFFQFFASNFITDQFNQFKHLLSQYYEYKPLINSSSEILSHYVWSHLFFGIQILSAVISTGICLLIARAMQAKLFFSGGLRNEFLAFRSGKLALLIFIGLSFSAYYEISYALNLLPLVFCYFLISGFSLTYLIFSGKRQLTMAILLFLLILLKPILVLFAYFVIGLLDSMINFRLYLPIKVKEST